jgi:hypothetical protein
MVESKEKLEDRRSSCITFLPFMQTAPPFPTPSSVRRLGYAWNLALLHHLPRSFVCLAVQSLFGDSRSKKA